MAVNFEGLGFSFAAKDDGFKKQTDNATKSMEKLEEVVKGVDKLAKQNKIGLIAKAFELLQLNKIAGGVSSINDKLRNFGKEGTRAAEDVSDVMSRVRADFVGSGKDAAKAQQMISSNWGRAGMSLEDAQKVGTDLFAVFSPKELEKSFGRYSELIHLSGTNSSEFAESMGLARKSMGMTEVQFDTLTDQVIAVGGRTGHATEALNALPAILKEVNERAARLNLKPEQAQQMAAGVIGLSGALFEVGVPMGEAADKATKMMTTMMDAQLDINKMRVGLEGSTDVVEAFAKGNVSLSDTLQLMRKDPLEAAKRLGKIRMSLEGNAAAASRFDEVMSKELDPSFVDLYKKLGPRTEVALSAIQVTMGKAAGSTQQYTDALKGNTKIQQKALEETYKQFDAKLGKIAQKTMPDLRKSIMENFGKAGDAIERWAADDGVLGKLTRGLITVKEYGFTALFGSMAPMAGMLGELAVQAAPFVTALGAMGIDFETIGKVGKKSFNIIGTASKYLTSDLGDVYKKITEGGVNFSSLKEKGTKAFTAIKDSGVIQMAAVAAAVDLAYLAIKNTIKVAGDDSMSVMEKVGAVAKGVYRDVLQQIGVSAETSGEIVETTTYGIKKALISVSDWFQDLGLTLAEGLESEGGGDVGEASERYKIARERNEEIRAKESKFMEEELDLNIKLQKIKEGNLKLDETAAMVWKAGFQTEVAGLYDLRTGLREEIPKELVIKAKESEKYIKDLDVARKKSVKILKAREDAVSKMPLKVKMAPVSGKVSVGKMSRGGKGISGEAAAQSLGGVATSLNQAAAVMSVAATEQIKAAKNGSNVNVKVKVEGRVSGEGRDRWAATGAGAANN